MELIIDNREKIKDMFKDDSLKIINSNLELGDYILKYKDQNVLVIERKTIADLMASIKDGRLREQKKRLLSNYPKDRILYIIEGQIVDSKFINKNIIISSIINTIIRDKITILMTKSSSETVNFIELTAKKIQKQGLSFMNSTDSIGYDDNIISNLQTQKKSNITKEICQKMMLCSIPSVSSKISERLMLNFGNLYNMIQTIKDISPDDRISYIQQLPSFEEKTRKIPKNVAENIINFLIED